MKVFGVFINIVLFVTLLVERNPAHGLMRVTGINAPMSKIMRSFNHQRGNKAKWYKYKRFQKIFGGKETKSIEDFPYMAFMTYLSLYKSHFACGATILSPKYLLTAAHCVADCALQYLCVEYDPKTYTVYVGSTVPERALAKAKVKTWHIHPEHKDWENVNDCYSNHDVAVVELRTPLQFNSKISRVQLPPYKSASSTVPVKNCEIIGWGKTYVDDIMSGLDSVKRPLKVARTNVIDNQECMHDINITYAGFGYLLCQSTQICTRDPQNIIGVCNGDSGGPLMCDGVQIGVVSWNTGITTKEKKYVCVGPNLVNVFSRVDANMDWIRKFIPEK